MKLDGLTHVSVKIGLVAPVASFGPAVDHAGYASEVDIVLRAVVLGVLIEVASTVNSVDLDVNVEENVLIDRVGVGNVELLEF